MKTATTLLTCIFALAACDGGSRHRDTVTVTEADAGKTVQLSAGQSLEVRLESNPTTGYRWQLTLPDDAPLRQHGEPEYQAGAYAEGIVGAGGVETWRFDAARAGRVGLRFEYRRPFEQGLPPGKTVEVVVEVVSES
ncbi:MAG: protease inhibitor I42 family protein [Solimonas sp.]